MREGVLQSMAINLEQWSLQVRAGGAWGCWVWVRLDAGGADEAWV